MHTALTVVSPFRAGLETFLSSDNLSVCLGQQLCDFVVFRGVTDSEMWLSKDKVMLLCF